MKTVLITGASRGIGAETARLFAQNGYCVAINYCHNKNAADALVEEILATGGDAFAVGADISQKEEAEHLVKTVLDRQGRIDVLIHNAGVASQQLLTDTTADQWQQMIGTHLNGAYYVCHAAIPSMVRCHQGSIVTVSSMWGITGASCEVAYSAAKAGLIGFTKALAKELGPSGIRVNCVAPGVIDTDMCRNLDVQTRLSLQEETPLCRLGTAEDVARSLWFLASDDASFITGQVLGVNGGFLI